MRLRAPLIAAAAVGMMAGFLGGCAVTGVGVEASVGYDGGYYEPSGYDYGGWGLGYRVGPSRCCDRHDDRRDLGHPVDRGHPSERGHAGRTPAYRPAPTGRSAPSIPSRSRSH